MRRIAVQICLFICSWFVLSVEMNCAQSSSVNEIKPGRSTRKDLIILFGEPVRSESTEETKVDYFVAEEKLFKEISGCFNANGLLQWARFRPLHNVLADDAPLLFDLTVEPAKTQGNAFSEEGNKEGETHHFPGEGVHFFVRDRIVEEIWLTLPQANPSEILAMLKQAKQPLRSGLQNSYGNERQRLYFGLVFVNHKGEGVKIFGVLDDTPAQYSGLRKDDILLEVENISLREKGMEPESFSQMIQNLPADSPSRFLVERNAKRFDVWIKPLRMSEERYAAFQKEARETFMSDYSRATQLMSQEDYVSAIEYFNKSAADYPVDSYRSIGICFMNLRKFNEALSYLINAYKIDEKSPLNTIYLAACYDNLGKTRDATGYYKKYLKMNHDNREMIAFAQERLEALKKKEKKD